MTKPKDRRTALAKALDAWLESADGKHSCDYAMYGTWLYRAVERAFTAGAAAQARITRRVKRGRKKG